MLQHIHAKFMTHRRYAVSFVREAFTHVLRIPDSLPLADSASISSKDFVAFPDGCYSLLHALAQLLLATSPVVSLPILMTLSSSRVPESLAPSTSTAASSVVVIDSDDDSSTKASANASVGTASVASERDAGAASVDAQAVVSLSFLSSSSIVSSGSPSSASLVALSQFELILMLKFLTALVADALSSPSSLSSETYESTADANFVGGCLSIIKVLLGHQVIVDVLLNEDASSVTSEQQISAAASSIADDEDSDDVPRSNVAANRMSTPLPGQASTTSGLRERVLSSMHRLVKVLSTRFVGQSAHPIMNYVVRLRIFTVTCFFFSLTSEQCARRPALNVFSIIVALERSMPGSSTSPSLALITRAIGPLAATTKHRRRGTFAYGLTHAMQLSLTFVCILNRYLPSYDVRASSGFVGLQNLGLLTHLHALPSTDQ